MELVGQTGTQAPQQCAVPIDVSLWRRLKSRSIRFRMNAVHRAGLETRSILGATVSNHAGHRSSFQQLQGRDPPFSRVVEAVPRGQKEKIQSLTPLRSPR